MSETVALISAVVIPAGTAVSAKGDGPAVEICSAESRVFLLDLKISEAVEQEYIELSLFGSPDGTQWATQPIAVLPQRFSAGEYPTLVDLSGAPAVNFVKVHWDVARWGRGDQVPRFVCGATLREIPVELLKELRAEAASRK